MSSDLPVHNAFAAARYVLEPIAEARPELGDLPNERADLHTFLERVESIYPTLSDGEKLLNGVALALWSERGGPPFAEVLRGLDDENRERVLRAAAALGGIQFASNVVDGRFGPQFTVAERGLIAELLEHTLTMLDAIADMGLAGRVQNPKPIRDLIERLRS